MRPTADLTSRMVTCGRLYHRDGTSEKFALPFGGEKPNAARFEPDKVRLTTLATVPLAYCLARRIAPWATITFVPSIFKRTTAEGFEGCQFNGEKWVWFAGVSGQHYATVSLSTTPADFISTTLHETWHVVETRLGDHVKAAIDEASKPMLYAGDDYYTDAEERRCRLFERWAMQIVDGAPPRPAGSIMDDVFHLAWTGELGAELDDEEFRPTPAAPTPFQPFALSSLFPRFAAFWRPATC